MDNKNLSISLSAAAVFAGVLFVLAGVGSVLYLSFRSPESASGAAIRPFPTEIPVASSPVPVQADPTPARVETSPTPTPIPQEPQPPPERAPAESAESAVEPIASAAWQVQSLDDTALGSGSSEFSAVTLNEESNRLMVADDEGQLFEYDLDAAGLPVEPARRVVRVSTGAGDIEGIAWMFGTTYVIAHEDDGNLTVVEIGDQATTINDEDVLRTIDTGLREINGNGLEGVAYLGSFSTEIEFAVVDERPATLILISDQGAIGSTIELDLLDASDVWANVDGSISVLSDEERVIVDLRIRTGDTVEIIDRVTLVLADGQFEQPEGLVQDRAGTRLYVVGEAPSPNRYAFGLWTKELSGEG